MKVKEIKQGDPFSFDGRRILKMLSKKSKSIISVLSPDGSWLSVGTLTLITIIIKHRLSV